MLQALFLRARRRHDGNGFQPRRRRFLGIFLTYRCIKQIHAQLFRKKQSILYPSFKYYPGEATDPFRKTTKLYFFADSDSEGSAFCNCWTKRSCPVKYFRCYTGKPGHKNHKDHNYLAGLCVMVVLRRLSYPCTFHELVDIFGYSSNRMAEMYHTDIDFIYFRYKKLVAYESWVPYFSRFARLMSEYGSPHPANIGLIDGTFTESCRPGRRLGVPTPFQPQVPKPRRCASAPPRLVAIVPSLWLTYRMVGSSLTVHHWNVSER